METEEEPAPAHGHKLQIPHKRKWGSLIQSQEHLSPLLERKVCHPIQRQLHYALSKESPSHSVRFLSHPLETLSSWRTQEAGPIPIPVRIRIQITVSIQKGHRAHPNCPLKNSSGAEWSWSRTCCDWRTSRLKSEDLLKLPDKFRQMERTASPGRSVLSARGLHSQIKENLLILWPQKIRKHFQRSILPWDEALLKMEGNCPQPSSSICFRSGCSSIPRKNSGLWGRR